MKLKTKMIVGGIVSFLAGILLLYSYATILSWILVPLIWVICWILSYALLKNNARQIFVQERQKCDSVGCKSLLVYDFYYELFWIGIASIGPVSLMTTLLIALCYYRENKFKMGLCFRMPSEFCKSKRS